MNKLFVLLLIIIAPIMATSDSLLFNNVNSDSLQYINTLNKVISQKEKFSLEVETAQSLAELGLYNEANDIISSLILKHSNEEANNKQTESFDKKKSDFNIELFNYYNKITDINKRILTSTQKDSIDLLSQMRLVYGAIINLNMKPYKLGISSVKPNVTFTNQMIIPGLKFVGKWVNNYLQFSEDLKYEKSLAQYIKDSLIINDTVNVEDVFHFNGFKKDSSDLFTNASKLELSNLHKSSNVHFSIPLKWLLFNFRHNKPILYSHSAISMNPYIEYQFERTEASISGSFYTEYMNYYGIGKVLESDTLNDFNSDFLDKLYFTPEISFLYYYKKFNTELIGSLRLENFVKRPSQFKDLNKDISTLTPSEKYLLRIYEEDYISYWFEAGLKLSFSLSNHVSLKANLDLQNTIEDNLIITYDSQYNSYDSTITLKGQSLIVSPIVDFNILNNLRIATKYSFESRSAPIHDSIPLKVTKKLSRYLWENYTAHEPELSFLLDNLRIHLLTSVAYRIEDVNENPNYEIVDSNTWKFKWNLFTKITDKISLSLNGLFENKTGKNDSKTSPDEKRNLSLNSSLMFHF